MEPRIQYAKTSDGVNIAYATEGEGPPLVFLSIPAGAHIQRAWEMFPYIVPLTRTFRLIRYDPRGAGLSDRDAIDFSMEAMMRDFAAIVDRTGLQSFALLAFQDSVPVAVTYAATCPDRVSHLILIDGWTNFSHDVAGMPAYKAHEALIDQDWTLFTETLARVLIGFDDPRLIEGLGEYIRACIEPDAYRAFVAALQSWDVADLLPDVKAQALVLHNNNARFVPVRVGQKLAAGIPDARFLTIDDMNYERVPALVEDFVGTAGKAQLATGGFATILFTDIESSTALTQRLGDAKAQEVRRAHNEIVRAALSANGGNEIKHTGDGIMASFTTASSALDCAIAIQRGVAANRDEHPDSPLGVYVGLNAGEPIAEDDPDGRVDLFGTSVDLAARLVDHAQPGQIIASDVVRQLAAGKDFLFSDLGETELRGFEDPVKLWELRWEQDAPA